MPPPYTRPFRSPARSNPKGAFAYLLKTSRTCHGEEVQGQSGVNGDRHRVGGVRGPACSVTRLQLCEVFRRRHASDDAVCAHVTSGGAVPQMPARWYKHSPAPSSALLETRGRARRAAVSIGTFNSLSRGFLSRTRASTGSASSMAMQTSATSSRTSAPVMAASIPR